MCIEHVQWKILEARVNGSWVYSAETVSKMLLVLSVTFFIFCAICGVVLYVLNWPIEVTVRIYL